MPMVTTESTHIYILSNLPHSATVTITAISIINPPMVGVPSLTRCDGGPSLPYNLGDLHRGELLDKKRTDNKTKHKGGNGGVDGPEGNVLKDIEDRMDLRQRI